MPEQILPSLPNPRTPTFIQQMALYNSVAEVAPYGEMQPPSPYYGLPIARMRREIFEETAGNLLSDSRDLLAAYVRHSFMDAFGIGQSSLNPKKPHSPFVHRMYKGGANYLSDLGMYMYSGKAYQMYPATKALGWFFPVPFGRPDAVKPTGKLGSFFRIGKASLKSYLGWNFILGSPEDMTLKDHTMSLLKHTAASFGIDFLSRRLFRNPVSLISHIATITKQDPIEKIMEFSGLRATAIQSPQTRRLYEKYMNPNTSPDTKKKIFRRLKKGLMREADRVNLDTGGKVYEGLVGRLKSFLSESSRNATESIKSSLNNTARANLFGRGLGSMRNIAAGETVDPIAGKGFFRLSKDFVTQAKRSVVDRTVPWSDVLSTGRDLAARTTRNAWVLGGMALRLANVASGVIAAGSILTEVARYRNKVREEYARNVLSDSTAFALIPEFGMSGTERTRAIEAIQNSGMSFRNYLGQEASMYH